MTESLIVHGPQGCGKTRHAQALAAHFGCSQIVDGWNGTDSLPPSALALTSAEHMAMPPRAMVLAFKVAAAFAGLVDAPIQGENQALVDSARQPVQIADLDIWLSSLLFPLPDSAECSSASG